MTETQRHAYEWEEMIARTEERARHLGEISDMPQIARPPIRPESPYQQPYDMTDEELSRAVSDWSSWEAYALQQNGEFGRLAAQIGQEKERIRSRVYLDVYHEPEPAKKTVDYIKARIDVDEEVAAISARHVDLKQTERSCQKDAEAFGIVKMKFQMERKHRREIAGYDPEQLIDWDKKGR